MLSHDGLGEEELRGVLSRAYEIDQRTHGTQEGAHEAVLRAAEEAGLSREAVGQAIQERLGLLGRPPSVGEMVFAKGEGDKLYPAEILEAGGHDYAVRFANGEERRVAFENLRPLNLLPGERLVCPWPDWGYWNCTIISYNPEKRTVKVTDNWGSEKKFDLSQVYRQADGARDRSPSRHISGLYVAAAALAGGVVGSVVTWLLTH